MEVLISDRDEKADILRVQRMTPLNPSDVLIDENTLVGVGKMTPSCRRSHSLTKLYQD